MYDDMGSRCHCSTRIDRPLQPMGQIKPARAVSISAHRRGSGKTSEAIRGSRRCCQIEICCHAYFGCELGWRYPEQFMRQSRNLIAATSPSMDRGAIDSATPKDETNKDISVRWKLNKTTILLLT